VPPEAAFDYLADPRNRPEWQSSLARVEQVDGEPRVGQRWVDVTRPGLRPAMETTELDRPRRWTEEGRWRRVHAVLSLDLVEASGGCDVTATMTVAAKGPLAPVAFVVGRLAPYAVRADLRRAAAALSRRS
jgi:Polyketide cyclase / dehydrase and lipid transport